ncbi:MAG: WGR domain-containing protein [Candidatus Pseudobacter hemicellulosilyticus]|uniref:WGR domain-containing protein n=1 Tax=Candidatus Pseudobacter hemicellulosilyticus TaxID=3121375 RepID=A0AAJ5WW79_9BACT|nr:MAG: WGR domain-containing protein [Pseudobacter sp.]
MRLIKQTILFFKEGNSDKVYEIDLCAVGNDQYVVNFRYGRRGGNLKEGSKTPVPVSLTAAERIFDSLVSEKMSKGYTVTESTQAPGAPGKTAFTLENFTIPAADWSQLPDGPHKAILKRLQQAVEGRTNATRTPWKLSRVIWKAGQYRIPAAAPYIIQLFPQGDTLHQYICTWAIARSGHEGAPAVLHTIHTTHPSSLVSRLAGAGLLLAASGALREQQLDQYQQSLPPAIKAAVSDQQATAWQFLLLQELQKDQPAHAWVETVYLLSVHYKWMRPAIKQVLQQLPFRPNYFHHIRAILKYAELLDDFEIIGLLAGRIEREQQFFEHHVPKNEQHRIRQYIPVLDEMVNPYKELLKKNSRLAYSQKTRWYLHRRVRRQLQLLGRSGNTDYVKLATSLLIAYKKELDSKEPYTGHQYKWIAGQYTSWDIHYPAQAQAVFLHQLLNGERADLELHGGQVWRYRPQQREQRSANRGRQGNGSSGGGILKKLMGLFSGKKTAPPLPAAPVSPPATPPVGYGVPFLHLWNQLPQSFIQLLTDAELEEIHAFAADALQAHASWNTIKAKLDLPVYKRLLGSPFRIPAELGFSMVKERYQQQQPEWDLVTTMLNARLAPVREKAMEWTNAYQSTYFQQSDFIKGLLFLEDGGIRLWARDLLRRQVMNSDQKKVVVGKAIASFMNTGIWDEPTVSLLNGAADGLFELFAPELQELPLPVIADLMQHPAPPVLLFGLRLLNANRQQVSPDTLSKSLLMGLLQHSYQPVRGAGIELLKAISVPALLQYQEEMIAACLSVHPDVRSGMATVIDRIAQSANSFGYHAAETLMPYLMRKETSEGLHEDLGRLLCQELSHYLKNANKETALNLLYGNYAAAQQVGVMILEKYTSPDQLTLPQVIALGGHENLVVRQWSWQFYQQQAPRIRYEREAAVKLLESKWEDTRQFAMQFFREQFTAEDWSPEALITLADSVKPAVEAFGRELITRFFTEENGTQYLLQLSQHPSEKMQLFATNYLERFAAGDAERIQSLEFYFRAVLTRVNKGRIAKDRIYQFLLAEGSRSEAAARTVSVLLSDISATAAIGDKASCIDILLQLRNLYAVATPLQVKPIETRA